MARLTLLLGMLASTQAVEPIYGGYTFVQRVVNKKQVGLQNLEQLAIQAETLPLNRIWLAFGSPQMVYNKGSNTLVGTGIETPGIADGGFSKVKEYVAELRASGIEVFLSIGGWDYNCFSYVYAHYSVGGYGTHTPNYWSINKYGNGDVSSVSVFLFGLIYNLSLNFLWCVACGVLFLWTNVCSSGE